MINIRIAGNEDINTISRILAVSWRDAYRGIVNDDYLDMIVDDRWIDFLSSGIDNNTIFAMVLELDGALTGAAILGPGEHEGEAALISFYLLPGHIGQGLGHAFYNGIEAELKRRGIAKCVLDVLEQNQRAIRFYESHGFTDTGKTTATVLGSREYTCRLYEAKLL